MQTYAQHKKKRQYSSLSFAPRNLIFVELGRNSPTILWGLYDASIQHNHYNRKIVLFKVFK